MSQNEVILRFNKVSFEYGQKPILKEADFSVRKGSKVTLMGQNGAGKSTIFRLITGDILPQSGAVSINENLSIATARQVVSRDQLELTVREFFEKAFAEKIYNIEPRIDKILEVVHLAVPQNKKLSSLSGGQQARLLLAQALIQDPDILLLDEPTNNLDKQGIAHLTQFLIDYKKTCIVISHDADFLNAFTHGVLYLDIFTKKVEQYAGILCVYDKRAVVRSIEQFFCRVIQSAALSIDGFEFRSVDHARVHHLLAEGAPADREYYAGGWYYRFTEGCFGLLRGHARFR